MAARSKGTLITTHRAEYVCPSMYPKYSGHFPNIKQESGTGFAQATKEHFQVTTINKGDILCVLDHPIHLQFIPSLMLI